MKHLLFDNFKQWRICLMAGIKSFTWGLWRIITAFLFGIASIITGMWRKTSLFVQKNPDIALGTFIMLAIIVWALTFAKMRWRAVIAEDQRDSISWQYQNFKKQHGYE